MHKMWPDAIMFEMCVHKVNVLLGMVYYSIKPYL